MDDFYFENQASQDDEIAALESIYGLDFHVENKSLRSYSIDIIESLSSTLEVIFPRDYPILTPPVYTLKAPWLKGPKRQELCHYLDEIYEDNLGDNVIYMWVERIRQFTIDENMSLDTEIIYGNQKESSTVPCLSDEENVEVSVPCPEITSGDIITDRKSHFQPHLASVQSLEEVRAVLKKLHENKKIANATHNMYAYRFTPINSSVICQDCEDDGEAHAGSRMLHLLQILDSKNVLVIVSRWYGGIQLGPDRFKHINNATRQILDFCGHIKNKDEEKKKKKVKS